MLPSRWPRIAVVGERHRHLVRGPELKERRRRLRPASSASPAPIDPPILDDHGPPSMVMAGDDPAHPGRPDVAGDPHRPPSRIASERNFAPPWRPGAAVDRDLGAGDVGGGVGQQPGAHSADLLRSAGAAERRRLDTGVQNAAGAADAVIAVSM